MLRQQLKRYAKLLLGFVLLAFGIVMCYQANIGLSPWDVLSDGTSKHLPITFGQASIITGLLILVIDVLAKERIGIGTFLNILLIGTCIDLFFWLDIVPLCHTWWTGTLMCLAAFPPLGLGLYYYISAGLGAGPRDSLMVVVARKLPFGVGICRAMLEVAVIICGWLLGGKVGFGTIILAVLSGPTMQLTFSLFKFDPKEVRHETLQETLRMILRKPAASADSSRPDS